MYKGIICILFILNTDFICAASVADSWILFSKAMKDSFKNCAVTLGIFDCLRHSSLDVFDKMLTLDVIPLTVGARFERYRHNGRITFDSDDIKRKFVVGNDSSLTNEFWSEHVFNKFFDLLKTHTLNIDFTPRPTGSRARHRHRNQMLPMMIVGVTALGAFTIPMGFQFLSIVSGKALLLAKMALMFAVMNGLKRVATSGVHYGLYHSEPHQHGYNYLDRGDINRPRSTEM